MERFEEELAAKEFSLIPSLLVMPFGEEVPKLIINRVPSNRAKEDEKDGRKETNETAAHMNNEIDVDITSGKKDVCIATSDDNHPERLGKRISSGTNHQTWTTPGSRSTMMYRKNSVG